MQKSLFFKILAILGLTILICIPLIIIVGRLEKRMARK